MTRRKNESFRPIVLCAVVIGAIAAMSAGPAFAAVTTIAEYGFEGVAGNNAALPTDGSGNNNDFVGGPVPPSPTYSADAAPAGGSVTSISFPTGASGFYWTSAAFPEDNFGFEVWAKTTQAAADGHLLGNSSNTSGIEVGTTGGNWYAAISSVAFVAQVPIVDDVWTHLAVVRDGGVTSFYLNGVFVASTATAPIAVTDNGGANAHLGVDAGGSTGYQGLADEARFFSFTAGAFVPEDLSFSIPAPAALPAAAALLAPMALRRRCRR